MPEELNIPFSKDPYKILGISPAASLAEIKRAYFSLIKDHTPEKQPEAFKRVRAAYEQIRSQKRREETDFLLFEEGEAEGDFQESSGAIYNVGEDILDLELWRLVRGDN